MTKLPPNYWKKKKQAKKNARKKRSKARAQGRAARKEGPLRPIAGNPAIIDPKDGSKCYVNDCLDKFVEHTEVRNKIISTAWRGGGPVMEITYTYTYHKCPCGKSLCFPRDTKKNKKALFGEVDRIFEKGLIAKMETFHDPERGKVLRLPKK